MNKPTLVERLKFYLPPLIWMGIIFFFSSLPTRSTVDVLWQDFVIKKTAHILEFAVLTLLIYRALINSGVKKGKALIISFFFGVLYGASDEFHQRFTFGREPTLRDVVFDTIGAGLTTYYLWKLLPKAQGKLLRLARSLQIG